MKKSSKILGSIALSAALCMGTAVPAFAVDAAPGTDSDAQFEKANKGLSGGITASTSGGSATAASSVAGGEGASTVVTVSTYTSQISVTVPLYLPIWLDTAGDAAAIVPSVDTYKITNNSEVPIIVESAKYANINAGKTNLKMGSKPASGKPGANTYWLQIAPKTGNALLMDQSAANTGTATANGLDWVLGEAGSTTTPDTMTFTVSGENGKLSQAISNEKLATITYTVSTNAGVAEVYRGAGTTAPVTPAATVACPDFSTYMDGTHTVKDVLDAIDAAYTAAGLTAPTAGISVVVGGSDKTSAGASYTIPNYMSSVDVIVTNAAGTGSVSAGGELDGATAISVVFKM